MSIAPVERSGMKRSSSRADEASVEQGAARVRFQKVMSDPVPIPEEGIARAVEILRSGRPFRYGEDTGGGSEASQFEAEFAALVGRRYAIGCNSCGCSLFLALRALGAQPGDPILLNAFTLAPVPGAIAHAGCRAVMVDIGEDLWIDRGDLEPKSGRAAPVSSFCRTCAATTAISTL